MLKSTSKGETIQFSFIVIRLNVTHVHPHPKPFSVMIAIGEGCTVQLIKSTALKREA